MIGTDQYNRRRPLKPNQARSVMMNDAIASSEESGIGNDSGEAYPEVPRRWDRSSARYRIYNLRASPKYNHHLAELLPRGYQPDGRAEGNDERIAVSLCGGFKYIRIRPYNAEPAPVKRPGWRGLLHGCAPRAVLVEALVRNVSNADIVRTILGFLEIGQVSHDRVSAVGCSSSMGDDAAHSMHGTLLRREGSWWISGGESARTGPRARRFSEFVEYELNENVVVRCDVVSMRIPSLPAGPLSVREFHLEVPDDDNWISDDEKQKKYKRASADFVTLDTDDVQEFAISPPIESRFVRVVCTQNADARFGHIGFFDIGFS